VHERQFALADARKIDRRLQRPMRLLRFVDPNEDSFKHCCLLGIVSIELSNQRSSPTIGRHAISFLGISPTALGFSLRDSLH
jgi:hypothetical protein